MRTPSDQSPPQTRSARRRARRPYMVLLVAEIGVIVSLVAALVLSFVPAPVYGRSRPVVLDDATGDYRGALMLMYVQDSWLARIGTALGVDDVLGRSVPRRMQDVSVAGATTPVQASEDAWAAVGALLGTRGLDSPVYFEVTEVIDGTPAARAGITAGDRFTHLDAVGLKVSDIPGSGRSWWLEADRSYMLEGVRYGQEFRTEIDLGSASPAGTGPRAQMALTGMLGAWHAVNTDPHPRARRAVDETGPSGGLADALTMIDSLGAGDMMAGMLVAASGVISPTGRVSSIGGVGAKTQAAIDAGADVLFVPTGNFDDAVSASRGRISVVGVETLYEAVAALCDRGSTDALCRRSLGSRPNLQQWLLAKP